MDEQVLPKEKSALALATKDRRTVWGRLTSGANGHWSNARTIKAQSARDSPRGGTLGSRRCSGGREGSVSGLRRLPAPGASELEWVGGVSVQFCREEREAGGGRKCVPKGTLERRRLKDEEPAEAVVPLLERPRGDDLGAASACRPSEDPGTAARRARTWSAWGTMLTATNGWPSRRCSGFLLVDRFTTGWKCSSYGCSRSRFIEEWQSAVASAITESLQRVVRCGGEEMRCVAKWGRLVSGWVSLCVDTKGTYRPDPLAHDEAHGDPSVFVEPCFVGDAAEELGDELFAFDTPLQVADEVEVRVDWRRGQSRTSRNDRPEREPTSAVPGMRLYFGEQTRVLQVRVRVPYEPG